MRARPPTPAPTPAAIGTIFDCVDDGGGAVGDSVAGGGGLTTVGTPETTTVDAEDEEAASEETSDVEGVSVAVVFAREVVATTPIVVTTVGASVRQCQSPAPQPIV